MRVISFSADGVREAAGRGFYDWLARQDADFVCIQDLRCAEYDLQDDLFFPRDYNAYFFDDIDGRDNGVAIYCRELPKAIMTGLGFADFDAQGRYIQADYADISVACLLAPQAADGDAAAQQQKDQFFQLFGAHLQKVRNKRRKYIICGNWQIAAGPADVRNAGAAEARSGYLPGEREWLQNLLGNGYVDAFREVSASDAAYTFWPEGRDGDGWRIDMQVLSQELAARVEHGAVYTGSEFSRHAPLIIDYDIDL